MLPTAASLPVSRSPCGSKAFSLIELLFSLVVLAVLVTLLIYAVDAGRDAAQSTKCLSNVRQIGMLHLTYANDNEGGLLAASINGSPWNWFNQLDKGGYIDLEDLRKNLTRESIFHCPSRALPDPVKWMEADFMHYGANAYPGFENTSLSPADINKHKLSDLQNPGQTFLVGEINSNYAIWPSAIRAAYPHGNHINLFFADGSARRIRGPLPPLEVRAPFPSGKETYPFY